jgi:hypothetical protein
MGLRGWAVLGWLTVLGRAVWAHDEAFVYVLELPPRFNVDLRDAVQQMVRGARHTPTCPSMSHPRAPSHPPSSQPCVDPGRGQAGCKARGGQCGVDAMYAVHGCYVCTSNVAQHTAEPSAIQTLSGVWTIGAIVLCWLVYPACVTHLLDACCPLMGSARAFSV